MSSTARNWSRWRGGLDRLAGRCRREGRAGEGRRRLEGRGGASQDRARRQGQGRARDVAPDRLGFLPGVGRGRDERLPAAPAQAGGQKAPDVQPIPELNPEHALVKRLRDLPEGEAFTDRVQVLFDQPCWPRAACWKTRPPTCSASTACWPEAAWRQPATVAADAAEAGLQVGLPPVLDCHTRVVVLGSFPGPLRWRRASTMPIRATSSGR